ncbi:MAG: RNA-binding transcriptional accessory protein [Gemmatimonadetes bacterium]|nr:MAG: RNA-binding transcriptional accessory protein [Gemmatimonadota bacterium]
MITISHQLAQELHLPVVAVQNTLDLIANGATIPFIARYRKEKTGNLDETILRQIVDRHQYLTELEDRKQTILRAISEQGLLTDSLREQIETCQQKTMLEDLYLPYKPKKRTRATVAREKGLEPLADAIHALNIEQKHGDQPSILIDLAQPYCSEEKGVLTVEEALQGASDILAERISEQADIRAYLRNYLSRKADLATSIHPDYPEGSTKYEMYRQFRIPIKDAQPHHILAMFRGEKEGILSLQVEFDAAIVQAYLQRKIIATPHPEIVAFYQTMLKDAFDRLLKNSLITEVRQMKKAEADRASIQTFEKNLRQLLLASPAGMKPTLGIDPGFRTGCKVVAVDATGKLLEYQTIFPHTGGYKRAEAAEIIKQMIDRHHIELIAIGNGTAGRETDRFIREVLQEVDRRPVSVMVNEAGASVYSASPVAIEEFPDQDVTVRGAVSIARRLQDPLAELVKIDPKSIGVGQYQHDVDQKQLKKKLAETVESCVNYVGVDLNTASTELLSYVSGITKGLAKHIVAYRNEQGAFRNRQELWKVPRFGAKAFEQASGFLRIRNGDNPLDNTAVHPERYPVVEQIARDLNLDLTDLEALAAGIKSVDLNTYCTVEVGKLTLMDIVTELQKPGRDPRAEFRYASFNENINDIKDLKEGMVLEGVVTNVTNFGAFVDIGVHQDGLVHISQLANRFVKDPTQIVSVGQVVKVKVLKVDETLKRITLSRRQVTEK